jgi:hypothetical protein
MKKLIFKPYTQKEIDKLLSLPLTDSKVKTIKVKRWFNSKTNSFFYGLDVIAMSGNICGMCEGDRAVVFDDRKTANKVCKKMIEQLAAVTA